MQVVPMAKDRCVTIVLISLIGIGALRPIAARAQEGQPSPGADSGAAAEGRVTVAGNQHGTGRGSEHLCLVDTHAENCTLSDLTLLNLFTEGWTQPWSHLRTPI